MFSQAIANGKRKKKNDEIKGRSPVCIILSQRIHLFSFSVWAVFKGNGNLASAQANGNSHNPSLRLAPRPFPFLLVYVVFAFIITCNERLRD